MVPERWPRHHTLRTPGIILQRSRQQVYWFVASIVSYVPSGDFLLGPECDIPGVWGKDAVMPENDADVAKIKELIEIMKANDLVKINIQHGDDRISLRRAAPSQPQAPVGHIITAVPGAIAPPASPEAQALAAGQAPVAQDSEQYLEIKSPIVGTFYEAPSPDSDAYVEIGSSVNPQTVVCIIEAMKVMNEIKAETSGEIVERVVSNGQAVEFGQVLFKVRPD